ncbi:MAG: carbamoyltransferase HypF [Candidatus Bathyarchaeota archaeon]|nr:carbamoyltransferase HypF [Candidatus Bathyarchaeota archaeon]
MQTQLFVHGIVQGVGFRPFIFHLAEKHSLTGFVRNRGDAGVEIVIEGSESQITQFLRDLEQDAPPLAQIFRVTVTQQSDEHQHRTFRILKSEVQGEGEGSIIPYDVATCDACFQELRNCQNRRHNYFFITCTQCGPRYTIIKSLPYDRPHTTMKQFPMCNKCRREYLDPRNRRFHAQTIACSTCGPQISLTMSNGKAVVVDDPIRTAGTFLHDGAIIAIKGNGGFHVVTSAVKSNPILRLRQVKHRAQKPFAVMARNLDTAHSFTQINHYEQEELTSSSRPIVLLQKQSNFSLSDLVAPGLQNIGVMLPYTGLHYMLFDDVPDSAFIMTSANAPSEPIVIQNEEAYQRLGETVDYFLLHDRPISQRCDDSVLRVNLGKPQYIRRSRGYAPAPLYLPEMKGTSLGVGAKENVNSCIIVNDRAFISQYIGDVEKIETLDFLRAATDHLLYLTKSQVEVVGCDLHPRFSTRQVAEAYGAAFTCSVQPIQHHHAHALALMGEWGLDEMIGIICDGAGYGSDGTIWGGEILYCQHDSYQRVGHLQPHPMVGGDLATRYPLRMAAGILQNQQSFLEWLVSQDNGFPYGAREIQILTQELAKHRGTLTSSCGRVLDAVAAILNLCRERTYSGEPAMKLEACAQGGQNKLDVTPQIENSIVNTSNIVHAVYTSRNEYSAKDLAYSVETYLARGLATLATEAAALYGVKTIGISGGVAYNLHICSEMKRIITEQGYDFKMHERIPPGDGGIAFGQAIGALRMC